MPTIKVVLTSEVAQTATLFLGAEPALLPGGAHTRSGPVLELERGKDERNQVVIEQDACHQRCVQWIRLCEKIFHAALRLVGASMASLSQEVYERVLRKNTAEIG